MTMKHLATILAVLGGLFLLYIGALFLLAPQASAEGFGVPTWPQDQGEGILAAKGVRDTGFGLVILALLLVEANARRSGWRWRQWPSSR